MLFKNNTERVVENSPTALKLNIFNEFEVGLFSNSRYVMVVENLMYSSEMKVFSNHVYEFNKGVRHLILYTIPKKFEALVSKRLNNQNIDFVVQPVSGGNNINLYFGKPECINAIKLIVSRPLNMLSAEEDFILGAMLGYDLREQCKRYCKMKQQN